jgi:hypothetical protein
MGSRHYWSPALVGFFGFGGGGFGLGFGFGNIGWVPLAPYEMFHPWWGRGYYGGLNRGMNITNGNLTSVYRNARAANGVSGVSGADFRAGRFSNIGRFSGSQIGQAGLVRGAMPITPSSANLRFSDRAVTNAPRSSGNTRFFSHQQASPAARVPFAQQQRAMERSATGTPNRSTAAAPGAGQAAPAQNAGRSQQTQAGAAPRSSQNEAAGGWRRFGEPGGSQQASRSQPAPQNNRGWTGFGNPGSSSGAPRQQYSQPQSGYRYSAPQSLRIAPPVVQQRSGGGSYSAPRSYSGGGSASRPSGGGGASHSSGGGSSSRGGGRR